MDETRKAGVFSRGIMRHPHLSALLGSAPVLRPDAAEASNLEFVVGWGMKANTRRARSFAARHGVPYVTAEDGFVRSVGLGVEGDAPLSVVLDDRGVYYDATRPSRLESILSAGRDEGSLGQGLPDLESLCTRAAGCIDALMSNRLSKYNFAPEVELPPGNRPRVLVVDQTAGDLSVEYGLASAESFERMLEAAQAEHPGAEILVKTHPDVIAGKKRAHLTELARRRGLTLLDRDMNPIRLLEQVDHVYVVTSQLGFEALMVGKPVTCFGAPFYAGWGLTDDRAAIPRRGVRRSLEEVFAGAYILYPRYVDPETGESCEIERIIEHLALQRRCFSENAGVFACAGFTPWKRNFVRRYLRAPENRVVFSRKLPSAGDDARLLVWASKRTAPLHERARDKGIPVWHMEDGFIRSPDLGSDFTVPASLVVDRTGIYYDPNRPSDLERLLADGEFEPQLVDRAERLRERIVSGRVSKYNVGEHGPLAIQACPGRQRILIPGQVEDDASIRLGCRDIRTNVALIRVVRAENPEAYIIYKPHPDVVSGNRRGVVDKDTLALCDRVVTEASLASCLEAVSEVHTMTSLVGFEALMRGLRVVTYGLPFYAGWGLTEDGHTLERRGRRRSLPELVAATLILYPRYVHPDTGQFTTPEAVVGWLERRLAQGPTGPVRMPWLLRQMRKLRNLGRELRLAASAMR